LIAVLFDPPHMYLCHVCMNKARKKYISVQGFPTVPSLFFLPTLAHFIGIFCKTPLSHHILVKHCSSQEIKIILKNKMVLPTYLLYFFYVPFLVNSTCKLSFKKKIPCPFSVLDKTLKCTINKVILHSMYHIPGYFTFKCSIYQVNLHMFVSDLRQICGFLRFPPPIKLKYCS
jgi:hypothetical protein